VDFIGILAISALPFAVWYLVRQLKLQSSEQPTQEWSLDHDANTTPIPVIREANAQLFYVGERFHQRVLKHLSDDDQEVVRITRLHWEMLLPAALLISLALMFFSLSIAHPTATYHITWPPKSLSSTTQTSTTNSTSPSSRSPYSQPVTRRFEFPIGGIYLLLGLGLIGLTIWKANPVLWFWTAWVVTSKNVIRMVLPPPWMPYRDTLDPLSAQVISGIIVEREWWERGLKSGTVTLQTRVDDNSPDPIKPLPDARGFAQDVKTLYEKFLRVPHS
jgi:hypothetical protein